MPFKSTGHKSLSCVVSWHGPASTQNNIASPSIWFPQLADYTFSTQVTCTELWAGYTSGGGAFEEGLPKKLRQQTSKCGVFGELAELLPNEAVELRCHFWQKRRYTFLFYIFKLLQ